MNWNNGYVVDTEYLSFCFTAQSPAHLNFACVLNGCEPVPIDRNFTYFELGFGQGLTLNILAASNPQGEFYGNDFMPVHVASTQRLATEAKLDNLTLLEESFADLANGKVDLPQFDFITMYGVYTWVNSENRQHIVNFLTRYLKPGGIVYINYNAMPYWSTALPMQWLLLQQMNLHAGGSSKSIEQGRQLIRQLQQVETGYFATTSSKKLQRSLDGLMSGQDSYIAHEYMNQGWQPMYHADVARELAGAKLDFIGSSTLFKTSVDFHLTPEQQDILETISDPSLRETAKDYMQPTGLREDIFVRGARRMTAARQAEWLQLTGLALTDLRSSITLDVNMPGGKVYMNEGHYIEVLNALTTRPHTLLELAALPGLKNEPLTTTLDIAIVLTASKKASPYFICSAEQDSAPAHRMNLAIARQSLFEDQHHALASSLLGTGVSSGLMQRVVYHALRSSPDDIDVDTIARQICSIMGAQQAPILRDGKPLPSLEEEFAHVVWTVNAILEQRLPIWRQLKVI